MQAQGDDKHFKPLMILGADWSSTQLTPTCEVERGRCLRSSFGRTFCAGAGVTINSYDGLMILGAD
eukprot:3835297-Heterocapsa_arctica.AAC.1